MSFQSAHAWIRSIYLYAMTIISLVVIIISGGALLAVILKATVFPNAENYRPVSPPRPDSYIMKTETIKGELTIAEREDLIESIEQWETDYEYYLENEKQTPEEIKSQRLQSGAVNSLPYLIIASIILYTHIRILKNERNEKSATS